MATEPVLDENLNVIIPSKAQKKLQKVARASLFERVTAEEKAALAEQVASGQYIHMLRKRLFVPIEASVQAAGMVQ